MTHRPSPLVKLAGLALVAALVALAPALSSSAPILRDDDDEERAIRRVEARRSFVENCLMCHGEDMTTRQRLTTKQWTAEVEKMVGWGAPLPPERKQPLIDHLSETYPSTQPPPPVERISPDRALALDTQPSPIKALNGSDPARARPSSPPNARPVMARSPRGGTSARTSSRSRSCSATRSSSP